MNTNEHEFIDAVIQDSVGAAYEVANTLGGGFLEKVYGKALARELALRGRDVKQQVSYSVMYKGGLVGEYFADLIVERQLVVELKCVDQFSNEHMAQCLNYLRASGLRFGLLLNFKRSKMQWKRIISGF
jgi:GxxExxY protein